RFLGLTTSSNPSNGRSKDTKSRVIARYDYLDETWKLLYQVERLEPKDFRQRRPGPQPGTWIYSLKGIPKVPYKLPEILKRTGERIYVVEGEKDAEILWKLGLLASTNAMGAGKWKTLDPKVVEMAFSEREIVMI